MNSKRELEQIEYIESEIDEFLEQRQYYYDLVTKITPAYKDINVQESSLDGSKLDTYITKTADILNDVEKKLKELDGLRNKYDVIIEQIDDVNLRRLLRLRYFMYKKWEDIRDEVYPNYTVEHVRGYLHGLALKKLNELLRIITSQV